MPFGEEIPSGTDGRTGCYGGGGIYPGAADAEDLKFTGKERDSETGLDYFGARYFSSAQGRFTSPDWSATPAPVPYADLTDPQTLNLYSYVRNNPLSHADADGHCDSVAGCLLSGWQWAGSAAAAGAAFVESAVVTAGATATAFCVLGFARGPWCDSFPQPRPPIRYVPGRS